MVYQSEIDFERAIYSDFNVIISHIKIDCFLFSKITRSHSRSRLLFLTGHECLLYRGRDEENFYADFKKKFLYVRLDASGQIALYFRF